jgi:hypothetical protein
MSRQLCEACKGITFSSIFDSEGYAHLPGGSLSASWVSCLLCRSLYGACASSDLCLLPHGHYQLSVVPKYHKDELPRGRLYLSSTCFTCGTDAGHQIPVEDVSVITTPGLASIISR